MTLKKNPVYDREGYRILDEDDLAKLVAAIRADSYIGRGTGCYANEFADEELAEWFREEPSIVTKWDALQCIRADWAWCSLPEPGIIN